LKIAKGGAPANGGKGGKKNKTEGTTHNAPLPIEIDIADDMESEALPLATAAVKKALGVAHSKNPKLATHAYQVRLRYYNGTNP